MARHPPDDDLLFKALADPGRRKLLDRLHAEDGQTLSQLCSSMDMSRQAVTQHLDDRLEDLHLWDLLGAPRNQGTGSYPPG